MKIREIKDILEAEILTGEKNLDMEINSACGADLMSDVMAYVKEKCCFAYRSCQSPSGLERQK